jgi:hypothetical protein
MELGMHDLFIEFEGFKELGRMRVPLGDARKIFDRYKDEQSRTREGVRSCWITEVGGSEPIRGTAPENWSPDDPVYENTR